MFSEHDIVCPVLLSRLRRPSLLSLLRAAADDRADLSLARFTDSQIRWSVATGLGPVLFRAIAGDPMAPASPHWPVLQGAELTARLLAAEQLDAMTAIVDACSTRVSPLTLLKGISICEAHYPSAHMRPMRDLDLLMPEAEIPQVQAILLGLGYREHLEEPPVFYEDHHHVAPLVHVRTGIWVEVHRGLSPPRRRLPGADPFCAATVTSALRPSTFQGRPVNRLSAELQVPYIASHWARSATYDDSGAVAMLDLIYLLNRSPDLQWDEILDLVTGSAAGSHLYLLLSYLHGQGLIDVPLMAMERLARIQLSLGRPANAILTEILNRYILEGREYGTFATRRNIEIIWKTLLFPDAPWRNLGRMPWHLLTRPEAI